MTTFSHVADANGYAKKVVAGKIIACEFVVKACARHLNDLKESRERGFPFTFNREKADRVCRFIEKLPHIKGRWANTSIRLEPWQKFILCSIFGWVHKSTGKRRFIEAFIGVCRKNGKSLLAAGIAMYMLTADDESGAEVYCGATSEKQAWEVFEPAHKIAQRTPKLVERFGITINAKSLTILNDARKFEPVIGKPGDGPSPHCFVIDEYHEHADTAMYDTAVTGIGAREQPLILIITTAGTSVGSPCKEKHDHIIKMLRGEIQDDRTFGIIYTIDKNDDWTDFNVWKKANPNMGISVSEEFLRSQLQVAMTQATRQSIIKCKHLNIWSSTGNAWINMQKWEQCASGLKLDDFLGERCWLALDLASKIDLCAMAIIFKRDGIYYLFVKHYLPEDTISAPESDIYRRFLAEGWLTETPGARTDFHYVVEDLHWLNDNFEIQGIGFDPKEATMLMNDISSDPAFEFECIEIPQNPTNISEPMKEFEALYLSGNLLHEGSPIINWQAGNVIQRYSNRAKSYYPGKEKPGNKIDGIVAAIMALFLALKDESVESSRFESEDADIFVI